MLQLNNDRYQKELSFEIVKQSDRNIVNNLIQLNTTTIFKLSTITITPNLGNSYRLDIQNIDNVTKEYLESDSEIMRMFDVVVSTDISTYNFRIERNVYVRINGEITNSNKDKIFFGGSVDETKPEIIRDFNILISNLRRIFKALYSEKIIKQTLSDHLNSLFEVREAELSKLETISYELIQRQHEYIKNKDKEYEERKNDLKKALNEEMNKFKEDYEKKLASIKKRELDFEELKKKIDDRDSKHVRRELRSNLKEEFKKRGENFNLTKGTEEKRNIIRKFLNILLLVFGLGLAVFSIISILSIIGYIQTDNYNSLSLYAKNAIFAIAFGSTSIYYLRWNNKWFEQHASEEFRMKRYEIDLDRASWMVEMALEWKSEKGTDIPSDLIDKLSHNLFNETKEVEKVLHPSEQIASALFGAAASMKIKTPNGSELELDRKSINKLK